MQYIYVECASRLDFVAYLSIWEDIDMGSQPNVDWTDFSSGWLQ